MMTKTARIFANVLAAVIGLKSIIKSENIGIYVYICTRKDLM